MQVALMKYTFSIHIMLTLSRKFGNKILLEPWIIICFYSSIPPVSYGLWKIQPELKSPDSEKGEECPHR